MLAFDHPAHYAVAIALYDCLTIRPNTAVKETRRPVSVLKVGFLIRFGDFAQGLSTARPLPLR
jgi:hypothetical protein